MSIVEVDEVVSVAAQLVQEQEKVRVRVCVRARVVWVCGAMRDRVVWALR